MGAERQLCLEEREGGAACSRAGSRLPPPRGAERRSDGNTSLRRRVRASSPEGGKPGEGVVGRRENQEKNTSAPDNSLAHESNTGSKETQPLWLLGAFWLIFFTFSMQISLCLPSLIKQLYY